MVTGMHRSATSLVASLLHDAGVPMGPDLLGPELGNARGHFEDRGFFDFHQQALLARGRLPVMGGDFAFAPTAAETQRALGLVAARRKSGPWGFKDPRASLFLDFWQSLIPEACFLLLYRHPLEVLASLVRRREPLADLTTGLAAWRLYNQKILAFRRQQEGCAVLCHAYAAVDRPQSLAEAMSQLTGARVEIDSAVRDRLYHATELSRLDLAGPIGQRFARLFPELDALYQELESVADLPAPGDTAANIGMACQPSTAPFSSVLSAATHVGASRTPEVDRRLALVELMGEIDAPALAAAMEQTGRLLAKLLAQHVEGRDSGAPSVIQRAGSEELAGPVAALRDQLLERLAAQHPPPPLPAAAAAPLASVIVVNFNGAACIARCLDCLLRQTYSRFEIVVVDNGSTDGSLALLEAYAAKGEIRLVRSPRNRGCAGGRNLGFRHARGELIA
ncbi:MAG TPA: glycosyltransferase, partial [Thermoanaerobaculia bacterium]|nr:glycosyltransferase [Thermoanaerobaculia bacterium]